MSQRKLFEEVGENSKPDAPVAKTGIIAARGGGARGAVRLWLVVLFTMVGAMVIIGGLTRLTDSGLSITEWELVKGTLPPMNPTDWQDAYTKYQASPEFQLQNNNMDLASFKQIYWWEWGHRFLGRMIGLVWALGFFFFMATKRIPPGWAGRLLGIGVLGGLQGAIGWWMVSSGLVGQMVDVASYRLATHLGLAFIILGLITWYLFSLARSEAERMQARRSVESGLKALASGLVALAFLQILLGALVAGIDAGRSFIDWPWMAGQFFPPDAWELSPGWRNFFENPGLVQFVHRMVAYTLLVYTAFVWLRARRSANARTRSAFTHVALMLLLQVVLGIVTVMYAAPLHAAITHQVGAIATWVLILAARHRAAYPVTQSIRG